MSLTGPGSPSINIATQPLDPTKQYVVVEYKYCEVCTGRFIREHTELRRIKDSHGNVTVIDPNKLCTRCEHRVAEEAKKSADELQLVVNDSEYASMDRSELKKKGANEKLYDRLVRECLRKNAYFDFRVAREVAKQMRRRHRGKNPCELYKCKCAIIPAIFEGTEYEHTARERQQPHWHLGGDYKRKF